MPLAGKIPIAGKEILLHHPDPGRYMFWKTSEKPKLKGWRIIAVMVVFLALFAYLLIGYPGRAVFRPQTFCREAESDAKNIYAAISDFIPNPTYPDLAPIRAELENLVDVDNAWTFTICGDRFFIHVIDRSGKCPAEYQNQYQEWNAGVYTQKF